MDMDSFLKGLLMIEQFKGDDSSQVHIVKPSSFGLG